MLPLPHVVVSTQLGFSVKNKSFDDMKFADYLFSQYVGLHFYVLSLDFINSL